MIKFCKKCNCDTERATDGRCKSCNAKYLAENRDTLLEKKRRYMATYYHENREKVHEYRTANADKIREYNAKHKKKYYADNADRLREYSAKWREKNPWHQAKWYEENKEKCLEYRAMYRAKNRLQCRIDGENRRAREREVGGKLSSGLTERLFKLQRGKCACCGKPLGDKFHLDHIMPIVLGGTNDDNNIQLLRAKCNLQKNAKHPVDFMRQRGFLL